MVNHIKHIPNREQGCHDQCWRVIQLAQYFPCRNSLAEYKSIINYLNNMRLINLHPSISSFKHYFSSLVVSNLYQNYLVVSATQEKIYAYSCKIDDQYKAIAAKGRGYWGYQRYTESNR